MKMGLRAVVVLAAASVGPVAFGQMTGVSHPEQVPVTTSPEGISQPVVYEAPAQVVVIPAVAVPAAAPALKERVAAETAAPVVTETAMVRPAAALREDDEAHVPRGVRVNPDAGIVTGLEGPTNQMPVGAMMKVRLNQDLSSGKTRVGTPFTAELTQPMERDGHVLLPVGSLVRGKVTDVHGGKRMGGSAMIHLQPNSVTLPDGTKYTLDAQLIDTELYKRTKVDEEGSLVRKDHVAGTLAAVGLSTGSGAAAGAVFGGWPGALIGAGIGAGVSTVVWLRADHQTELPAGTELTLGLTRPLTVGVE